MISLLKDKNNKKQEEKSKKLFYRPKEFAEIYGVNVQTIYYWIHEKKIPHVKIGGSPRIPKDLFEEWIKDRTIIPGK